MLMRSLNHTNSLNKSSFTPVSSGLLQRKCSCGKCSKCQQVNSTQQQQKSSEIPPVMHDLLKSPSVNIQPKLKIAQPNDKYEQEADRVADQIMRMPDPSVQRQENDEEEEELLQTKPIIQRRVSDHSGGSPTYS